MSPRVRFVSQMQPADCGAACVAAIALAHGVPVSLRNARVLCDVGREGTTAAAMVRAGRALGFDAWGTRVAADEIVPAELPAIAHFAADHFVVVERRVRGGFAVMDPAIGRRRMSDADFAAAYTGILLRFTPTPAAQRVRGARVRRLAHVGAMYVGLLRSARRQVVVAVAVTAVLQLSVLLTPLVVANVARPDRVSTGAIALVVAVTAVAFVAVSWARGWLLLGIKMRHDRTIMVRLVTHVVTLPLEYFQARSSADLLARLTGTATIRDALSAAAVTTTVDAAAACIYILALFVVSPPVAVAALVITTLLVVAPVLAYRLTRSAAHTQLEKRSAGTSNLLMLLIGIEQAKAHGAEDALVGAWWAEHAKELAATERLGVFDVGVQTVVDTCRLLAAPVLVLVAQATTGSPVRSLGIGLSAAAFVGPVSNLTRTLTTLVSVQANLARIDDVLEEPSQDPDDAPRETSRVDLEVESLSFSYAGSARPAVADVTMSVPAGETVLVVGASGCGKSTLARLVAGLLTPHAGSVRFAGADGATVRPALGYVAQSVPLFPGTIRTNVAFGRDADDEAILHALWAADLDVFTRSLRSGLHTRIVDGGQAFSGGQRQRLAIARALLGSPPVVILDEATNSLDAGSEERILARLRDLRSTKLVIGHRPELLRHADRVAFLRDGRLVAFDTHDALMRDVPEYRAYWSGRDAGAGASTARGEAPATVGDHE